jgi:uncharacterized membrane protein YedE/YeeE
MVVVVFRHCHRGHYVRIALLWTILWVFVKPSHALHSGRCRKKSQIFDFNWRTQIWNLVFLSGAIIGGFIAKNAMSDGSPVLISESTISALSEYGFAAPTSAQPDEIFSWDVVLSLKGFLVLSFGGLMVGFGARYAGGCTSGHAISGLSDLQVPSLVAVIGFFAGGLLMTHLLFPLLF